MSAQNPTEAKKAMTAADAAKLVKRVSVVTKKDDTTETVELPVRADEVVSFRDYGTHVVVVTTSGEKLTNARA